MKQLTPSSLFTLLVTVSVLANYGYATGKAGASPDPLSPPGSPKLSEDGPGRIDSTTPAGGPTQKASTPDAANSAARGPARAPTKVVADGRYYSNHCRLEDTTPAQSYRVPMATRWWQVNKADVKFCVVAGAIKPNNSGTPPYQLNVVHANGATILMATAAGGGAFSVGGAFGSSPSLWSTMGTGSRMGSSEFCSSGTVKHTELSTLRLNLNTVSDGGSCGIRFASTPWVDGRAQIVPTNPPRQPQ